MRAGAGSGTARRTFANPVIGGAPGDDHGDPFVIKYLDSFYLYHSGETSGRRGISVHRSSDLVDWEFQGYALEAADAGWAWSDLWAPEVVYERGVFYMYFSATSRLEEGSTVSPWQTGEGDEQGRRLGLARATSPLGPFVPDTEPLVDVWSIDGHPFRDDDGTLWLFYNVQTASLGIEGALPGTGTVCDRLVAPDRLEGKPVPVTIPSEPWEGLADGRWYWNEAPYVLKRRGRYFQMYSGGYFNDGSYAIGYADARSPRGPWRKDPRNPIFGSTDEVAGPGHHSFVFGPDAATRYAVYHGYVADAEGGIDPARGRKVLLDRHFWVGDHPEIAGPTAVAQSVPPPPTFDPAVDHWRTEAWVRGRWFGVGGQRYALAPHDVWHQVEVVQADGRHAVRVGGVLRASLPRVRPPTFESDGDVAFQTVTSVLHDEHVHELPRGSEYVWRWGGLGPIELSLAVRGAVELSIDDHAVPMPQTEEYSLVRIDHLGSAAEIAVRAEDDGAAVADLSVYARSSG